MSEKTILVIDDDRSLRRVMEYLFKEEGYTVLTAADGNEGLRIFRSERPTVVITDLQMPVLSGFEVLKTVKKENPETVVIVITAFGSVDSAVEAMKAGAFDYISKPCSRDMLQLVIQKALTLQGLRKENSQLKQKLSKNVYSSLIGSSDRLRGVIELVKRVADSKVTVLLLGESGTGKDLVARMIHEGSCRSGPFVPVNCAGIPRELLESELFGHVKGSFTGAVKDHRGKFEQADGGTLFLDEIGELPLELQPKLLRALQEREIEPVGGSPLKVDVRIVAATNLNIEDALDKGTFREDLYYRLAVVSLTLPPLRERRDDIPLIMNYFLDKHGKGREVVVSEKAVKELMEYDWPGNVRELENVVERMLVLCRSHLLDERALPPKIRLKNSRLSRRVLNLPEKGYSLEQLEKDAVIEALFRNEWNQTRAAAFLQIPRHVLAYRIEKYNINK